MIGIPLSMWVNGQRNWKLIIAIWVSTLIIVGVTAMVFWYYIPIMSETYLYIALFKTGVYIFVLYGSLTMWRKINPNIAVRIIILAVAVDLIVASLLGNYLLGSGMWEDWVNALPHLRII